MRPWQSSALTGPMTCEAFLESLQNRSGTTKERLGILQQGAEMLNGPKWSVLVLADRT